MMTKAEILQNFFNSLKEAESVFRGSLKDFAQYSSLREIQNRSESFFKYLPTGLKDFDDLIEEEFFHSHMSQEGLPYNVDRFINLIEKCYDSFKKVSQNYLELRKLGFDNYSLGVANWLSYFENNSYVFLLKIISLLGEKKTVINSFLDKGDYESAKNMLKI